MRRRRGMKLRGGSRRGRATATVVRAGTTVIVKVKND